MKASTLHLAFCIFALPCLAFVQKSPIKAPPVVTLGASCSGDHLQGMATDGVSLYWGFGTEIIRSDMKGRKTGSTGRVRYHHGGPCVVDGVVYAAANHGKFNTETNADSWVYAYGADDLKFRARWKVPELRHGAGGIAYANGSFYVVGGLPEGYGVNFVYEYDRDFRFVARHVLKTGYTYLGIQAATFHDGLFYFGCYGRRSKDDPAGLDCTITATPDFKTLHRWFPGSPEGIVPVGGKLAFAITPRLEDKSFGAALYPFDSAERREIAWPAKRPVGPGGRVRAK
ncbi:MAG: hypothetical protein IJI35_07690 [Kiritimatiellae bacterium]|nr:hypothetical protein [Kiritimatiellia bacterium]MBQ6328878.1 hypothetical protein [Kiritimatiellia bacterium]